MASSVWSMVEGAAPPTGMPSVATGDPAALINNQLESALSTMGDAQYWEESISPSQIRQSFASSDPSNPNSTPTLLRGMKWLLASISKGRNVSDFFPHVVKLVGAPSLEVRKMVYMYLVQYADHDVQTRELSLLSINSFQRGLVDNEQLIRALALRVLSSIRIGDIIQIQILGVQKCASDRSPYVRKCAANAIAKLYERCDRNQQEMLMEIMNKLLREDTATMVLTSVLIAFSELCPDRLEMIHSSFRKICHLLTDMDEWGQVVVLETLARYCRKYFRSPRGMGSAEAIDQERRVRRTLAGISSAATTDTGAALDTLSEAEEAKPKQAALPPHPGHAGPKRVKRRVVKKGFYSDEEDESTEEEVYVGESGPSNSLSAAMRQTAFGSKADQEAQQSKEDNEDDHLDEDHRLLLRSSLPLLKSRNSGVVLAVCSLHYYCGVASIKVRAALGKALVRIHRDRREIQYVVLTSIRTLARECPSAFTPFLSDFFVKGMDPSFTRLIKLEILTALALDPKSIEAVLKELRNYIRHEDKVFICASIRAVGKVVELARIVHDRHGKSDGTQEIQRNAANTIALNSLFGLITLAQSCETDVVVGECAVVMGRILLQLSSDGDVVPVVDKNRVMEAAMKRLVFILMKSMSSKTPKEREDDEDDDDAEDVSESLKLPPHATGTTLWVVGEWLAGLSKSQFALAKVDAPMKAKLRLELVRVLAGCFSEMEAEEKLQALHFACKLLLSAADGALSLTNEGPLCELIMSMGRAEVNADVRDRARSESAIIQMSLGLQHDSENMTPFASATKLSLEQAKHMLLQNKPSATYLPLEFENESAKNAGPFRFGTLSSLVGHRAKSAYLPLPDWSQTNSSSSLREPTSAPSSTEGPSQDLSKVDTVKKTSEFYDSESDSDSNDDDDDDDGDDSSESDSSDEESSSSSESSDDDDSDSEEDQTLPERMAPVPQTFKTIPAPNQNSGLMFGNQHPGTNGSSLVQNKAESLVDDVSSGEDSEDSDSDSDSSGSILDVKQNTPFGTLLDTAEPARTNSIKRTAPLQGSVPSNGSSSALSHDLEGLVMAPIAVDVEEKEDPDLERDSGTWLDLVRHELAGGLAVKVRYLRGVSKNREAKLMGMDGDNPSSVVLQVKFENRRTDAGVLRRVRIIQRTSTSGPIGPRRVNVPQEITALGKNQMTLAMMGIEFQSISDKDGAMQARFEIKSDRGNTNVDIRPSLAQLVMPLKLTMKEFENEIGKLQGFSRVTSSFTAGAVKDQLPLAIVKHIALKPLDKSVSWSAGSKFRMAGTMPASSDRVFIDVDCDKNGIGKFTVCCENAMATNSFMDALKAALKSIM